MYMKVPLGIVVLTFIMQQTIAIDLKRIRMYKQQDLDYNIRGKSDQNNFGNNLSSQDEEGANTQLQKLQSSFPKVSYNYEEIPKIIFKQAITYSEKSKLFEGLSTMLEQEKQSQTTIRNFKDKYGLIRLQSIQFQEDIFLKRQNQCSKLDEQLMQLNKHLSGLHIQTNSSSQVQNQIKERIIDLEDLNRNLVNMNKRLIAQKEVQKDTKQQLRDLQRDFKDMVDIYLNGEKIKSIQNSLKIFSDSLKKQSK